MVYMTATCSCGATPKDGGLGVVCVLVLTSILP